METTPMIRREMLARAINKRDIECLGSAYEVCQLLVNTKPDRAISHTLPWLSDDAVNRLLDDISKVE